MTFENTTKEETLFFKRTLDRDPEGWGGLFGDSQLPPRFDTDADNFKDGTTVRNSSGRIVGWFEMYETGYRTQQMSLYVVPEFRNKSYGSKIMQHCINMVRVRTDATRIINVVHSNNENSLDLHSKFGFVEHARITKMRWRNGQAVDKIYMEKRL